MTKPRGPTHRAKTVSIGELSHHFHLPINEVASKLGVCVTVLKQRCREYGITRWPYRKVRKLDTLISSLKTLVTPEKLSPEQVVAERKRKLERAVETRTFLLSNPNSSAHLKLGKVKAKTMLSSATSPPRSGSGCITLDCLTRDCGFGSLSEVCSSAMGEEAFTAEGSSLRTPFQYFNTFPLQTEQHSHAHSHSPLMPTLRASHPYTSRTETVSPSTDSSAFSRRLEDKCASEGEEGQVLVDFLGKMESNLAPHRLVVKEAEPKNLATQYSTDKSKSESRQRLSGLDLSSTYRPSHTPFWSPAAAEKYQRSRLGSGCHLAATNSSDACPETRVARRNAFDFFPSEKPMEVHAGYESGAEKSVPEPFLSLSCAPIPLTGVIMIGVNGGLGNY